MNGQTPDPRPRYDSRIELKFGPLLDTLVAAIGHAPASIKVRPLVARRGRTKGADIALRSENDEGALLHELGHFFSDKTAEVGMEAADSLRFDPFSVRGGERLADLYADALRARLGRNVPDANSDVRLLMNLLAAASKRRKQEAQRAEDTDALVDGLIRRPPGPLKEET